MPNTNCKKYLYFCSPALCPSFSVSLPFFLSKTKKTALIIFPLSAFPYSNTNSSFFPLWINLKGPTAASLFLLCLFLLLLLIMTFTAWLSAVRTWLSLTQRCPDCSQLDSALSGQFSAWLSAVRTVLSLTQRCLDSSQLDSALSGQCVTKFSTSIFSMIRFQFRQDIRSQSSKQFRGMMYTAEFLKNSKISAKSKPNSKILYSVYQGPRWACIMKKWRKKISWHTPCKDAVPIHIKHHSCARQGSLRDMQYCTSTRNLEGIV